MVTEPAPNDYLDVHEDGYYGIAASVTEVSANNYMEVHAEADYEVVEQIAYGSL